MFVVTFYSYKGGVGRTSALMNVAAILAKRRKKVLIIDFDLEAPGIDAFPECSQQEPRPGLVEYITRFVDDKQIPQVKDFVYSATLAPGLPPVLLMPAGTKDAKYQSDLSRLDWKMLYKQKKGFLFIENLKASLKQEFNPDYLLIDSRTGLTDVSGICTLQLPNLVVLLFNLNNQNLRGTEQIFKSIRFNKLNKPISTMLVASPIPELPDSLIIRKERLESARKTIGAPADLILPYDPFFSFEETIIQDSKISLSKAYENLTDRVIAFNQTDVLNLLQEAKQHRDKGNIELAELRFQEIIEAKPESFEGWYEFGVFARMRGRLADSVKYLEKAVELEPKSIQGLAQLALAYLSMKKSALATTAFMKLLATSGKSDHEEIRSVITSFVRAGLLEPAITGFLHLIKDGAAVSNYTGLAEIYMRTQRYEEAFEVYTTALKTDPTNIVAAYNAGHALARLGRGAEAVEYYKKAVELFEVRDKSAYSKIWLANGYAAIGYAYAGIGKYEHALQSLANAISIATDLERAQIFSPITYVFVSKDEFISGVAKIADEVKAAATTSSAVKAQHPFHVTSIREKQIQEQKTMANVYVEARPKGRPEGSAIQDYVVEDHADQVLGTFKTQKEAIDWAKARGHAPLVARVRHLNNKKNPDHWRSA